MTLLVRSSRFGLVCALAWVLCSACGGSSSETPFPLPPHPLNEPYRVQGAAEPAAAEPAPTEPPGFVPAAPRAKAGAGRSTWGSDVPPPLPEMSPH